MEKNQNKLILCVTILLVSIVALCIWQVPKILDKNEGQENNGVIDNSDENDNMIDEEGSNQENNQENNQQDDFNIKYVKLDMEKYNSLPTPVTIETTKDLPGNSIKSEISSELKEKLYKSLIFETVTVDPVTKEKKYISNLYRNEKTTINDLSENEILLTALRSLVKCEYDSNGNLKQGWYSAKLEDLKDKVIELYGVDPIGNDYPTGISESQYGSWAYKDGEYKPSYGGPKECFSDETFDYPVVDIRKDDNNLYVYTEIYFYYGFQDYSSIYASYNDYINDNKLGSTYSDDGYVLFEGEDKYNNRFDFLKENYPKVIHTYKHTFKKNTNGEYYWVSSEPLTK